MDPVSWTCVYPSSSSTSSKQRENDPVRHHVLNTEDIQKTELTALRTTTTSVPSMSFSLISFEGGGGGEDMTMGCGCWHGRWWWLGLTTREMRARRTITITLFPDLDYRHEHRLTYIPQLSCKGLDDINTSIAPVQIVHTWYLSHLTLGQQYRLQEQ